MRPVRERWSWLARTILCYRRTTSGKRLCERFRPRVSRSSIADTRFRSNRHGKPGALIEAFVSGLGRPSHSISVTRGFALTASNPGSPRHESKIGSTFVQIAKGDRSSSAS